MCLRAGLSRLGEASFTQKTPQVPGAEGTFLFVWSEGSYQTASRSHCPFLCDVLWKDIINLKGSHQGDSWSRVTDVFLSTGHFVIHKDMPWSNKGGDWGGMSIKQETPRTGDRPSARSRVLTRYCVEAPGTVPGRPRNDPFPGLDSRLRAAGTVRTQGSVVQVTRLVVFVLAA